MEKSSAFFSRNVKDNFKQEIFQILRFVEADENSHYLGLPNFIGRKKSAMLGYIKEKVHTRVRSWDEKILTKGGKKILLKTFAQAIPNYAMSIFLLPLEMCKDVEKIDVQILVETFYKKRKKYALDEPGTHV